MEFRQILKTEIGFLIISASEHGVRSISLSEKKPTFEENSNQYTEQAAKELIEYFNGSRKEFNVSLDWEGHSEFYKTVWSYLQSIPIGKTKSYGEIARYLENPGASRAVGLANGKNPIPIIVPCHRVIGSNGALTGFALGLEIKKRLLALENPESFGMQGELFS